MAHRKRTASARQAVITAGITWADASVSNAASSEVSAVIITMLATSEHHWQTTLPAIYFLLSLTVPISRLSIIMNGLLLFVFLLGRED